MIHRPLPLRDWGGKLLQIHEEVLLSTNAVSSIKVVFFRKWMYDSHIFCAEKWSTSNIEHLNLWYQFDHWKLQFDKDFPKRKLFWLFIPETSSRTAVFLGLILSAYTCQWYPGCLVTWDMILCVIARLLPWQSKSKKHQKTFYIPKSHRHVLEATLKSLTVKCKWSTGMHKSLVASVATSSWACRLLQ